MKSEPRRFVVIQGTVTAFDEHAGWGTIRAEGGDEWFFHCTRIADGTRSIPVGTAVEAMSAPIGLGEWEAIDVRTLVGLASAQ